MSKFIKLIKKILDNPKNVRFNQVDKILKYFGYERSQPRSGSSHYTYRKEDEEKITIPFNKPIKAVYIKIIIKLLDLEDWYEQNK